jgi:hypothetical protein
MARRKAKVYSRFDVATYMQEKKRLRKETALAHKALAKKKSKLDRIIYRVSACKILFPHLFWEVYRQIYSDSS